MSEINDMYTIYFKYLIKMYGSLESSAPYRLVRWNIKSNLPWTPPPPYSVVQIVNARFQGLYSSYVQNAFDQRMK